MRPKILFISHVNPVNPRSGQQQRVHYSLKAARVFFHTTFLTLSSNLPEGLDQVNKLCDETITLDPILSTYKNKITYAFQYIYFVFRTGLKKSNFIIGEVEFSSQRLESILKGRRFDYVLFEYWYAHKSVVIFKRFGIPCILDMHDVLWRAFEQQIKKRPLPFFCKERIKRLYQQNEQTAWKSFDRIISINKFEQNIVKNVVPPNVIVDYIPMGIDLGIWEYLWKFINQGHHRLGFYGGLSSKVNVDSALRCIDKIMPIIWETDPNAEFWLIGNRPADVLLQRASQESRIKITGYVEKVHTVIAEMGVVLCPWEGVFGFRSRIIEVMAVGVPLVVSEDAIAGMGITEHAIKIGRTDTELANIALEILENEKTAQQMSLLARQDVEQKYSFESTYLDYFENLAKSLEVG